MKKVFFCVIISVANGFFYYNNIQAQVTTNTGFLKKRPAQIEISQYFNFDKYPGFRYNGNRAYDQVINIKGDSWGIDAGYKFNVFKKIYIKPFLGYYRFSFNKIDNYNELFQVHGKGREITSPPTPTFWIYSTNRYFYNCINIGISAENEFMQSKFLSISGGVLANNYIVFSQKYFLTANPDHLENPRKKNRTDFWGLRADVFAKLLVSIGKVNLGPTISLPIYTFWKTDAEFPYETGKKIRNKWINGWGIGVSASYPIK